ncbi:tRNA-dihydrouridine synthase 3 [Ascosphaera aggregata]|nr:tRNA-dihydrouridine synthase 3 [Ascosphaera aggregata]
MVSIGTKQHTAGALQTFPNSTFELYWLKLWALKMTAECNNAVANGDAVKRDHSKQDENATEQSHPAKRFKLDEGVTAEERSEEEPAAVEQRKGTAPIKKEFLIVTEPTKTEDENTEAIIQQDRAERKQAKREKNRGQNTNRRYLPTRDEKQLCQSVAHSSEFSPITCAWGDKCRFEHNIREYLSKYKRKDLTTFDGICPVWKERRKCSAGWKCRFVGSHMKEVEHEDGRKELVLIQSNDEEKTARLNVESDGIANSVSIEDKSRLMKRKYDLSKADTYVKWIFDVSKQLEKAFHSKKETAEKVMTAEDDKLGEQTEEKDAQEKAESREEQRASYVEPPFLPSEKRRLYFGPETPVLAPLTTTGNLPFRRLCVEQGAAFTYSEMAMSMPLIQGAKSEWALMKCHESETLPPPVNPKQNIVHDYDNSRDMKFGAQIAANKPWQALKATQVLTELCPHLRVIDLNCGCPIDLLYREGAGSALLDQPGKLEKILRGMNAVSGEVPISVKVRMGTKENRPTALKLMERLVLGGAEFREAGQAGPGVAAVTLHGRSRQQRYSKAADWKYIAECAALVKRLSSQQDTLSDTVREMDERNKPSAGRVFFLGNGDCYSHVDYYNAIDSGVDTVMIARGALVKPWIFEEIQTGQYLDKSASERLDLIQKYVKYGLEAWGSDEVGVGTTRRFLLEWLSFTHRYIPIGVLEYLPPNIQDRPPAWKGRNDLETLLASENYKDWIKISEMFLGPVPPDFKFEPKHKSNAYEVIEG